jgi:NAD+ synthase
LSKELNVVESILKAKPTDGLFHDERSDEDQMGATYDELEWAMLALENHIDEKQFSEREKQVMEIYKSRNTANKHKMEAIPVCNIPKELL